MHAWGGCLLHRIITAVGGKTLYYIVSEKLQNLYYIVSEKLQNPNWEFTKNSFTSLKL